MTRALLRGLCSARSNTVLYVERAQSQHSKELWTNQSTWTLQTARPTLRNFKSLLFWLICYPGICFAWKSVHWSWNQVYEPLCFSAPQAIWCSLDAELCRLSSLPVNLVFADSLKGVVQNLSSLSSVRQVTTITLGYATACYYERRKKKKDLEKSQLFYTPTYKLFLEAVIRWELNLRRFKMQR